MTQGTEPAAISIIIPAPRNFHVWLLLIWGLSELMEYLAWLWLYFAFNQQELDPVYIIQCWTTIVSNKSTTKGFPVGTAHSAHSTIEMSAKWSQLIRGGFSWELLTALTPHWINRGGWKPPSLYLKVVMLVRSNGVKMVSLSVFTEVPISFVSLSQHAVRVYDMEWGGVGGVELLNA